MEVRRRKVVHYLTSNQADPFAKWLRRMRDNQGRAKIEVRLNRIEESGNLGDCRAIGEGVYELRVDYGPGYRVYFGEDDDKVVLLCGGDKDTQMADIPKAKEYWKDYNA